MCNQVSEFFSMKGYNVRCYTGDDTKVNPVSGQNHYTEKSNDLKNVNESWSGIDLLLFTSCVSAGVDYSLEHYDSLIGVYSQHTCDAMSFIQGLHRVRKIKGKEMLIYIQQQSSQFAGSPS